MRFFFFFLFREKLLIARKCGDTLCLWAVYLNIKFRMKCIYIYIFSTKVVAFRYEYLDISTVFENSTERNGSGYKGGACIYLETERRGKDKK